MPAKLAITHQLRQHKVCNAIASARIEGITFTKQLEQKLTGYIYGKKSIAKLIEETKQSYIKSSIK
jgi:Antitoxin VbhA